MPFLLENFLVPLAYQLIVYYLGIKRKLDPEFAARSASFFSKLDQAKTPEEKALLAKELHDLQIK